MVDSLLNVSHLLLKKTSVHYFLIYQGYLYNFNLIDL